MIIIIIALIFLSLAAFIVIDIGKDHYKDTKKQQTTITTACEECGSDHITVISTRSIAIRKYAAFVIKIGIFTLVQKIISFLMAQFFSVFFKFSFFMLFSPEHTEQIDSIIENAGFITVFIGFNAYFAYYFFLFVFIINLALLLYTHFAHNNQHYNVVCLKCGRIETEKEPKKGNKKCIARTIQAEQDHTD